MGIDSSSKSCGIAIFLDGRYEQSWVQTFDDTFSIQKFRNMTLYFDELFKAHKPDIVLLEEPLAVRNGRTTRTLNLIGGMIFGLASSRAKTVDMLHNRTIKSKMGFKTKDESKEKALELHDVRVKTDDESDAILLVDTYIKLVSELV